MNIITGGKATLSQFSAIQRLDNLSDEDTQAELQAIQEDSNINNPLSNLNMFNDLDLENKEEVEENNG